MEFGDRDLEHIIIDLGSGSGQKIAPFLQEARDRFAGVRYVPIDTAQSAIDLCHENMARDFPGLPVLSHTDSWEIAMNQKFYDSFTEANITVFFLGSTIGNFSEEESTQFIDTFMDIFRDRNNARLVIMFDRAPSADKPRSVIEDAYNIEAMIAIDWHMSKAINQYLEIDIPLDKLKRCAHFDPHQKALVRWMELTEDCTISHTTKQQPLVQLKSGTRIQTEISRKYDREDISNLAKQRKTDIWMTPDNYYMSVAFQA